MGKVAGYRPPSMIEVIRMDLQVLEIAANAGDLPTARRSVDAAEDLFRGLRVALTGRGLDVGNGQPWNDVPPGNTEPRSVILPPPTPTPISVELPPLAPMIRPWLLAVHSRLWTWGVLARLMGTALWCSCVLLWRLCRPRRSQ